MELDLALLDCGFSEMDARIIAREFLSGVADLAEAMGGGADQKVGEVLTNDQAIASQNHWMIALRQCQSLNAQGSM